VGHRRCERPRRSSAGRLQVLRAPTRLPAADAAAWRSLPEAAMAGRRLALARALLDRHAPRALPAFLIRHRPHPTTHTRAASSAPACAVRYARMRELAALLAAPRGRATERDAKLQCWRPRRAAVACGMQPQAACRRESQRGEPCPCPAGTAMRAPPASCSSRRPARRAPPATRGPRRPPASRSPTGAPLEPAAGHERRRRPGSRLRRSSNAARLACRVLAPGVTHPAAQRATAS
jgi:hypothetical protein